MVPVCLKSAKSSFPMGMRSSHAPDRLSHNNSPNVAAYRFLKMPAPPTWQCRKNRRHRSDMECMGLTGLLEQRHKDSVAIIVPQPSWQPMNPRCVQSDEPLSNWERDCSGRLPNNCHAFVHWRLLGLHQYHRTERHQG